MPATNQVTRGNWHNLQRWLGALLAVAFLLGMIVQPALAVTYRFSVPQSSADVYVNEDGTVSIDYYYLFKNDPSADPIDAVDVGMPTTSYDKGSISATINGNPVRSIDDSPYVKPGIALDLGSDQIQPGQSGEVRVHVGKVERMLFKADNAKTNKDEPYGSFQFQPNYFGSEFVTGQTNMTVTLHLLPNMKPEEPIYFPPENWPGESQPESAYDDQNRVYYSWNAANASSSAQYTFGAAFPARLVPAGALLTETPNINFNFDSLCPGIFCLGFLGFIGLTIYASIVGDRKRKLEYLPPKVAIEGNGIKRGLTAVEAAILMQQPMDKILTMILFSVIKKGAAEVVVPNPMQIKVAESLPESMDLRPYETQFIQAMAEKNRTDQRKGLQNMMTDLVKAVSEKMRGFSRKETVAYYQDIMQKAWTQVEQANTPEMKMQMWDDAMDWTMLDRNFDNRTRDVFGPRPVFVPMWWGRFDPTYSSHGGMSASSSVPNVSTSGNRPPTGVSMPNLPGGDFAGSMVAGMQNFAGTVVGDLTAFTGGVTAKTNPPPPPSTSTRSGGGGGGHCACACACACAGCACACAGGGR